MERGTVEQLTTDPGRDSEPIWSPDSTRIAYLATGHPGGAGIFMRRADGTGDVERLTRGTHLPSDWSADGKRLPYIDFGNQGISPNTVSGLMVVEVAGNRIARPLLKGAAGRIDPSERWVATTENDEVYVRPFADPTAARTRVSTDGGRNPVWSRDGKTLFYRRGQAILAVALGPGDPSTWPNRRYCSRVFPMCSTSGRGPTTTWRRTGVS